MTKLKKLTLAVLFFLSLVSMQAMEINADQITLSHDKKTHTCTGNVKFTLNHDEAGLKISSNTSRYSQGNNEVTFEGDVEITLKNATIKTSKVTLVKSDQNTVLKMATAILIHK